MVLGIYTLHIHTLFGCENLKLDKLINSTEMLVGSCIPRIAELMCICCDIITQLYVPDDILYTNGGDKVTIHVHESENSKNKVMKRLDIQQPSRIIKAGDVPLGWRLAGHLHHPAST